MVTIVDPHIKIDSNYKVYQEAHDKGLFIQKKDGGEFDGWRAPPPPRAQPFSPSAHPVRRCWPGSSAYLDFTAPHVRDWWASRFEYDNYVGSTPSL